MDEQATRPKPRSYTEDYKRHVVDLVASSGRTPTAVAGEVGLHPTLLCRWVRQYGAGAAKAEAPPSSSLCRFRRPTKRLSQMRSICPGSRGSSASATGCAWSATF